jgi:phosphoglycolate phosphatase
MPRIRGLLFDKDGTLFDFAATWTGVFDDTLARLSDDAALRHTMALAVGYDSVARIFLPGSPGVAEPMDVIAVILAEHLPELSVAEIETISRDVAEEAVINGALVPAVPDMAGFLDGLLDGGYRLGIATHDSEAAAHSHLRGIGVLDRFEFVAGYDSGHGLKPGPGMLLAFAAATGLAPGEIAMIGDSIHDLGVAPAAGAAMAIGVLTGPAVHADLAPHADHVLDSIAGLPALLAQQL